MHGLMREGRREPVLYSTCFIFDYKAELIHHRAPWKTKEAVELATLEWVA